MSDTPLHGAIQRLMKRANYSYVAAGEKIHQEKYDRHVRYAHLLGAKDDRYTQYNASREFVERVAGDVIEVLVDRKYSDLPYRDASHRILTEYPVLKYLYSVGIATNDTIDELKQIVEPLKKEDVYY